MLWQCGCPKQRPADRKLRLGAKIIFCLLLMAQGSKLAMLKQTALCHQSAVGKK
jgi:hypothetical protein